MTADPEVKETPNGIKVASFSLATNQVWKDAAGVKQEKTDFHNIVAWKGLADIVEQYTKKGKKLFIQWRLQTRSWEKDWIKHYRTEVVADNLILLTPKAAEEKESITVDDFPSEYSTRKNPKNPDEEIAIEDIPF